MIMTTNKVGETMGRVMWKNCLTLDAPSRLAASYRVAETFCRPASSSTAS